ncbi:MAG: membrane assembly protein AsmA, partial [Polaromonas sp. 28-63-22]
AAFDVKQGVMTSRALVLDTSDTVITGRGQISFADETLDLILDPAPKDFSILSFRSPLRIAGTFAAPKAGPDKTALAGRAGIALALAAINPLLALAATVETGPGKDADCAGVFAQAQKKPPAAKAPARAVK